MPQGLPPIGAEVPTDQASGLPPVGGEVRQPQMNFATVNGRPVPVDDTAAPSAAGTIDLLQSLKDYFGEATQSINPVTINKSLNQAFYHPLDTITGLVDAQVNVGKDAVDRFKQGDIPAGLAKSLYALIPLLGPRLAQAGDYMQEGQYAKGLGATTDVGAMIAAPEIARGSMRAVESLAEPKLRASSATNIKQALNPTRDRLKVKTERITPEIQKRGLAGDLEDLKALAGQNVKKYGEKIDATISRSYDAPVELQSVRDKLNAMKAGTYNDVKVPGRVGTERAVHNPTKLAQIDKVESLLDQYGDTMTAEQAHAVRKSWDEVIARAGGFDEKAGSGAYGVSLADWSEANVKRPLSNALRRELQKSVPDLRAINKEYGFWKDLEDVVKGTKTRKVGQQGGLSGKVAAAGVRGAGAVVGYGSGGGGIGAVTGALVAGELAERFTRLTTSPKWRLQSAAVKTRLADALASGSRDQIATVVGQMERAQGLSRVPETAAQSLPKAAQGPDEPPQ